MNYLETIRGWIGTITQIFLVLVPLAIVLTVLFGSGHVGFVGDVVNNLIALIRQFGDNGLIGLIALGIVLWLFTYYGGSQSGSGRAGTQV